MKFAEIQVNIFKDDSLRVTATWYERGKGCSPYLGKQTKAEIMEIHNKVKKFSSYFQTYIECHEIDWYEAVNEFKVPGFSITKGSRKKEPQDDSYYTNSMPKSWEIRTGIMFKPAKNKTNQIIESLKALGVINKFNEAEIKKLVRGKVRGKGSRELFKEI